MKSGFTEIELEQIKEMQLVFDIKIRENRTLIFNSDSTKSEYRIVIKNITYIYNSNSMFNVLNKHAIVFLWMDYSDITVRIT